MQAGLGEMDQLRRAILGLYFVGMDAVEESTRRVRAVWLLIRKWCAIVFSIPAFARDDTGMAADTCIKINDKPQLFG